MKFKHHKAVVKSFLAFLIGGLLTACDNGGSFASICKENPEICEEFHEDSWCKKERIAVGKANLAQKNDPADIHKFNQLIAYENYDKCVSHAAKIEHIKLKEKKTKRVNNMMKARARIEEISEQTKDSMHPRLLYFHWTRYLDKEALRKFLTYEGKEELETPESQVELATYYMKRDEMKTLKSLFHALELYKGEEPFDKEIFKTLASVFAQRDDFKQSYIWLKVLYLYDETDTDTSAQTIDYYATEHQLDNNFLDQVALSTLNKIKDGTFTAPKF